MSTVDLMLLGALIDEPLNAYEMKKKMDYRNIKEWVKISAPSIYKNLVKLHKKGYLDGETVKEGEMPEKKIYHINDKGRQHFMRLMKKYSDDPGRVYMDFTAFIANLHNLDKDTGLQMMTEMQNKFYTQMKIMERVIGEKSDVPYHARALIELYLQIFTLIHDWSGKLKKEFIDHESGK